MKHAGGWILMITMVSLWPCAMPEARGETIAEHGGTQYRGLRINNMSTDILEEARHTWGANLVFYMPRPWLVARRNGISVEQAWEKIITDWPAQLDEAKRLGLAVAIWVRHNELPNPRWEEYPDRQEETRAWQHAFWTDESNLELLITYWKKFAAVGKGRDQEIWYQPVSEANDWEDFPSPPRHWPRWAQTLVNEIQSVDPDHPVLIEPGPGGLCRGYEEWPLLEGNIIHVVHAYPPHQYTHQGIKDITGTDLPRPYEEINVTYPGVIAGKTWNRQRLKEWLQPARAFQEKHGGRMLVGEFSVVRWAPGGHQYLDDLISIFEEYGWDWTYHAFRQARVWSLEHGSEYKLDVPATESPTERANVLLRYLQRNAPPAVAPAREE